MSLPSLGMPHFESPPIKGGRFIPVWFYIICLVGIFTGTVVAFFLHVLNWVTQLRIQHSELIYFLPLGGLLVGLLYYYGDKRASKGNQLIFAEVQKPKVRLPFVMTPMVLLGTWLTHLVGGSAGREGTALQLGTSLADQVGHFFPVFKDVSSRHRHILILMGVSAGFSAVFGTPLAGTVFALEVFTFRCMHVSAVLPVFAAAMIGHFICLLWGVEHAHYLWVSPVSPTPLTWFWVLFLGCCCGLVAHLFISATKTIEHFFKISIKWPPLRPAAGGLILLSLVLILKADTSYLGLGLSEIEKSFEMGSTPWDFAVKLLFTALTLGAGFKGGEVTPLFFIGATFGSAFSWISALPPSFLAGLGFLAVFAGATQTPLACILMGIELYGYNQPNTLIFLTLVCLSSWLCSGAKSIYPGQRLSLVKLLTLRRYRAWKENQISPPQVT